jgi:hypothetical protein
MIVFQKSTPKRPQVPPYNYRNKNSHIPSILPTPMSPNPAFNPRESDSSPTSPISLLAFQHKFLYPHSFTKVSSTKTTHKNLLPLKSKKNVSLKN